MTSGFFRSPDSPGPMLGRRDLLKGLTAGAVGLSAPGLLAGCDAGGGDSGGGLGSGKGTIEFWFFSPWVKSAVVAFQKANRDITVNFRMLGYADVHNKLLTSLAAGSGAPDVVGIELGYMGAFASKGGLTDLTADPFRAAELEDDFVSYKWQQGSNAEGALVGMPWDVGPGGVVYRTDLLEKFGIETDPEKLSTLVPTWDDWIDIGTEIRRKSAETALVADAFADFFLPGVEQQGHGWFDGDKVVIEEKATESLELAVKARAANVDAKLPPGSPEWAAGMKRDAFVAYHGASWAEGALANDQPQTVGKWRAMRAPGGAFNIGGSFLAIPEQSTNKRAAWEFVKFLTATKDGANIGLKQGGALPSYKPAWNDPIYHQPVEFYGGQKAYQLWLEIAQDVPGSPLHPGDREASDIVNAEVSLVDKQDKEPAQAMRDAEDRVLSTVRGAKP